MKELKYKVGLKEKIRGGKIFRNDEGLLLEEHDSDF